MTLNACYTLLSLGRHFGFETRLHRRKCFCSSLGNYIKLDLYHYRPVCHSVLHRGTQQWSFAILASLMPVQPRFKFKMAAEWWGSQVIIKWHRRVRLHFVTLIKSSTYLIECLDISALINAITIFLSLFWIQIFNFSVSYWLTKTLHVRKIPLKMCDGSNSQSAMFTLKTPWMQWRLHNTSWHFLFKISSLTSTLKFVLATCVVLMVITSKNVALSFSHCFRILVAATLVKRIWYVKLDSQAKVFDASQSTQVSEIVCISTPTLWRLD